MQSIVGKQAEGCPGTGLPIPTRSNFQTSRYTIGTTPPASRSQLVQIRCDPENGIRGVLRMFGIIFGRRVGGFGKRAEEIVTDEPDASPTIRLVVEAFEGAYLGLTPKTYASGATMKVGRISRRGGDFLRRSLYMATNALLPRVTRFGALKAWGLRIAKRGGFKRAKVAVARKLAVVLHAMWTTGEEFRWASDPA